MNLNFPCSEQALLLLFGPSSLLCYRYCFCLPCFIIISFLFEIWEKPSFWKMFLDGEESEAVYVCAPALQVQGNVLDLRNRLEKILQTRNNHQPPPSFEKRLVRRRTTVLNSRTSRGSQRGYTLAERFGDCLVSSTNVVPSKSQRTLLQPAIRPVSHQPTTKL